MFNKVFPSDLRRVGVGTDLRPAPVGGDFPENAIGMYVEVGGSITFRGSAGVLRTVAVADNSYHPFVPRRITAATASGIFAVV